MKTAAAFGSGSSPGQSPARYGRMELRTGLIDSREKRWFGKVARAAEKAVNCLAKPIGGEVLLEIHAHFNTAEDTRVEIVDYQEGKVSCTQVVYAAKGWRTVADSIPEAAAQLASAAVALAPLALRPELASAFSSALKLTHVHRTSRQVAGDGLTEFCLYLEQALPVDAFFTLIEKIDIALSQEGAGEVSGNAYNLEGKGACIDLVGVDRETTERIANGQVRAFGIDRYRFES